MNELIELLPLPDPDIGGPSGPNYDPKLLDALSEAATAIESALALESSAPVRVVDAFEEYHKADHRDPAVALEWEWWQAGWKAAVAQQPAADGYCITREDGECVSSDPRCMHNKPAAMDEAIRRDAERYRWLRDNAGAWEVSRDQSEWTKCGTGEKYRPRVYFTAFSTGYGGMFLDDAIDAAMQGANP